MVLFSSITQFIEQVGRTRQVQKRDTLDTLTRIYTGPTAQLADFIPANGTPDVQYSLMTVISVTSKDLGHGSGVSEVQVNYQGKLASGSRYTSLPTISTSWSEGEISYSQVSATTVAGLPSVSVMSFSHRYTGRNVTVAFITNFRPSGEPTNLGKAKGYMGFTNEWDTLSAISYGAQGMVSGYFQDIRCTDVKVDDIADGWYKVTETYQSRMFPSSAQAVSAATGKIFLGGSQLAGNWPTEDQVYNDYNQQQAAQAKAAADAQAQSQGLSGASGSPPSYTIETTITHHVGVDPGWTADQQQQATAVTPSSQPAADSGTVSPDATQQPDWASFISSGMGDWASGSN
jgi:hypothetical protein